MKKIYIGTDSGATTSKTCGIFEDGTPVTLQLAQSATNASLGRQSVIQGWIDGVERFLAENHFSWNNIAGVGLAIPGPYQSRGVLDRTANLPADFEGWNFFEDYSAALAERAGRSLPLVAGNDGNYGGVAEAAAVRGDKKSSVIMLAPGSGLGGAFIGGDRLPLEGDTLAGMEAGHMPAPLHLLGLPVFSCGCGRTWGCFEAYTSISGLSQFLAHLLPSHPNHPFHTSSLSEKEKVLSLRTLAQKGDPLALEIFDYQAKALGIHAANLSIALDAEFIIIGGGLIDPGSTTEDFRTRYLEGIRKAADPWLFPVQRRTVKISAASLGELSQSIGAALMALYSSRNAN